MADDQRTAPHSLSVLEELERAPYAFDFFQALRRIEALYRDRPRWGESQRPADEPVRLGQDPDLAFPASTLSSFSITRSGRVRLGAAFFGAFGPNGALPVHLTEYARQRMHHHGDPTFARFVDVFHHRLLSLVYRVWASSRPAVQRDRVGRDRFALYAGALSGRATPAMRDRDAMPDAAKLFYVGRLSAQQRNAEGLAAIVSDFFQIRANVEEFVGEWLTIPPDYVWRVGAPPRRGGFQLGRLGVTTMLGSRVWTVQHKFRLALGPLSRSSFVRLSPGGASLSRLVSIVRNYTGDEFAWDLRLIPQPEAVHPMQLGTSLLGRTTWLVRDIQQLTEWEDLVFDPQAEREPFEGERSDTDTERGSEEYD